MKQNNQNDKSKSRQSLMGVFKNFGKIFKATKRSNQTGQKAKDVTSATTATNVNPNTNFVRIETQALHRSMNPIAKFMVPNSQVTDLAKMKMPAHNINLNSTAFFFAMIIMFFVTPFIAKLFGVQSIGEDWLLGLIVAIGIWAINYVNNKRQYKRYAFKNQLRFNKLLTVLDLSELKQGYSINALLAEVSGRFQDPVLSNAVSTLNSRIQDKPMSPMPYLQFANEFSTTQRARLFMLTVYRMAQGNYDDSEIKSIKHSASKDLTYQSEVLMRKKLGRFHKLWLMQFAGFVLFLITYVLMFIGLDVYGALKGAL